MQPKLTPREVKQIRLLSTKYHYSHAELAAMFNVSRPTISRIVANRTWKEVTNA
jgi:plasmid maintenance system antidote protein VapI